MNWITRPGWPGNLLALAAGALTPLMLAPFDIWPLALVPTISRMAETTAPAAVSQSLLRSLPSGESRSLIPDILVRPL